VDVLVGILYRIHGFCNTFASIAGNCFVRFDFELQVFFVKSGLLGLNFGFVLFLRAKYNVVVVLHHAEA